MKTGFPNRVAATSQTFFACAALIVLVFVLGCGGSSVPKEYSGAPSVSGTVTMDQTALVSVNVSFENSDGGPFQTVTNAAGKYTFEYGDATPPLGKYLVRITDAARSESADDDSEEPALPARYNSETELVVDVLAGENSIDFPLLGASEDEAEEF
jgi:hypothetical protein